MKNILFYSIFTAGLFFSPSIFGQVNNGLVAKYSFFGNANDEIGNNHGVVNGATLVADRFGIPNRAYQFDGFTGHSINLGNSNILKPTACTISLWAYIDSNACYQNALNYQPFIVTTNTNAPAAYYEAYALGYWLPQPQLLSVNYKSGATTGNTCFSSPNIQTKQWYHFVVAFDNDSVLTYINNVLVCANAKTFTTTYSTDDVVLGITSVPSKVAYLNGRLDDIRFYNRRLKAAEVDTLFNLPSTHPAGISTTESALPVQITYQGGNLTVQTNQDLNKIEVLNLTGSVCRTFLPSSSHRYLLNNLNQGIYLCRVILSNKQTVVHKIFVE